MPDARDPNFNDSGLVFGLACFIVTWLMLGLADDAVAATKAGGLLSLAFAFTFILRAERRGQLAGLPFWPAAPQRDGNDLTFQRSRARAADADVWFAQTMSGLATCMLTLALVLPLIAV